MRALKRVQDSATSHAKAEECRWQQFFQDPTMWWDNRTKKKNPKYPDFVHTCTGEGLWTDSRFCPEWLLSKLGSLQDPSSTVERGVRAQYKRDKGVRNLASSTGRNALKFYDEMRRNGTTPNISVVVSSLKFCSISRQLETGRRIHADIASSGEDSNMLVSTTLVDMYAKCGDMLQARRVFERMQQRDSVSWNAIIMGYAQSGEGKEALELFKQMQDQGFVPVARTFVAAINACRVLGWLEKGKEIHQQVSKSGFELDIFVANSLLDMYSRCGCIVEARELLDRMPARDVVSWTCVISGYAQGGNGDEGLRCFSRMRDEDVIPDGRTYVAVFKACTALAMKENGNLVEGKVVKSISLERARAIHSELEATGCDLDIFVSNTLVDMYAKCGSMIHAQKVFDRMRHRSVVSWTALILGYAQNAEGEAALNHFQVMKEKGIAPNALTYCSVLRACASLAALEIGRRIHLEEIRKAGLERETAVQNSLISFYGRCGCMEDAKSVFNSTSGQDLVTWNALMAGYSYQGDVELVLNTFENMRKSRITPDGVTFLLILTGCSHAGLVEKGKAYFELMRMRYGISPSVGHYTSMIDLLGRAERLEEALTMAKSMPCEPDMTVWMTILGACRKWKNVRVGEAAFEALLKLDKKDAAGYVLMGNIYSAAGMHEESARIECMRREVKAWKKPGQSWWVDSSGKVHKFVVGDCNHPQITQIQAKLKEVHAKMKEQGYVPHVESVFHDIATDEKEIALCEHSERLAIGCALVNTPPGTPVRIVKNLRVCNDCHKATAILSKVEQRVVTCRDGSRFHVFQNGQCSCGDFW